MFTDLMIKIRSEFYLVLIILLYSSAVNCSSSTTNVIDQPKIFINQSDSIFILAKYGQTVSLPCLVQRQQNQELSNIHVIWKKLFHSRANVLSIGNTLLRQDMRYIVKKINNNSLKDDYSKKYLRHQKATRLDYSKENWQFEIRRLNYEDAGIYQCSLPLERPLAKNITLQVIPDLSIEPKKANFHTFSNIEITCQATLRMPTRRKYARKHLRHHRPFMSWYKENELIRDNHNVTQEKKYQIHTERVDRMLKSTLKINDANIRDSGKYRCIYENIQEHAVIGVSNEYSHKNLQGSFFGNSSTSPSQNSLLINIAVIISLILCFKSSL